MGKIVSKVGSLVGKVTSTLMGQQGVIDAQKSAAKQAAQQAERAYQQSQESINAANAKEPDIDAIRSSNTSQSSTMLTGSDGVELDSKNKKRKSLLGE